MTTATVTPKVTKKASKKAATEVRPGSNFYRLSAAGKKIEKKDIRPATHKGACLLAIQKLGNAPFSEILAEVKRQRKIDTEMEVDKAVRWMLFDMVRKGILIAVNR